MEKVKEFLKPYLKENLPDLRAGDWVKIFYKIKEGGKERVVPLEGLIIAKKHGKEIGATITIRREVEGVGVENIIPIHSPNVQKIEILKREKVKRAKLYYLRKK